LSRKRIIAPLLLPIRHPTQMDDHPSITRRKKSDKAKEKHERTPYSSQHVRLVANAIVATKADSRKKKHKNKNN